MCIDQQAKNKRPAAVCMQAFFIFWSSVQKNLQGQGFQRLIICQFFWDNF